MRAQVRQGSGDASTPIRHLRWQSAPDRYAMIEANHPRVAERAPAVAQLVRSAVVTDSRAARTAGSSPPNVPIASAMISPPSTNAGLT